MNEHFDVVIIGSGAGGAPIANELVKQGKKILILEKGPKFQPQFEDECGVSDFKRDELFATGARESRESSRRSQLRCLVLHQSC